MIGVAAAYLVVAAAWITAIIYVAYLPIDWTGPLTDP